MNRKEFKRLIEKKVLLFDGGMGTELYSRGVFINKCFEELNLTNPTLIKEVHNSYIKAGCDVIETNTFGANRFKLKKHQLGDKLYEINYQGASIAREAAGEGVLVAGSIGPLNVQIEPLGSISEKEAEDYFAECIKPLVEGGVDLLIFETFIYPNELEQAIKAARRFDDIPVIAQLTIDEGGRTLTGAEPATIIAELEHFDADSIGVNCTVGPQVMLNWLEKVRKKTAMPVSIMPNAGKPKNIEGRNIYLTSPEYLGEYAKHFYQAGANIIGGCCGTSPGHIKKMRNMLNSVKPDYSKSFTVQKAEIPEKEKVEKIPVEKKSRLARRMKDGRFVTFVELLSPHGIYPHKELEKAREMNYYGIDVINIPDGPRASARMSALSLAVLMQKEVGIETVLHYVCRDRNVIGMQSDLLGAYALGIKNILAVTGDPPKLGNYPDATAVFDVDSIGLVNILNRLNSGLDIAGNPIGSPTGFYIGVGANPGAVNLNDELKRLDWKIDAGAEYIITQPVFDLKVFENFVYRIKDFNIPVVAGLWPLVSLRNAQFMNNEIPGINVPQSIMKRLEKYEGDKESSINEGIDVAREILDKIKGMIDGIQISAPFGRVSSVIKILQGFENIR